MLYLSLEIEWVDLRDSGTWRHSIDARRCCGRKKERERQGSLVQLTSLLPEKAKATGRLVRPPTQSKETLSLRADIVPLTRARHHHHPFPERRTIGRWRYERSGR
ncbi:hypothetical protein OPV22_004334 [Ensete ventricosum]|uniref:Uncharacterized protein n=1 Tax=Ensete ventricosum TaxID=4639 RepID=A0AAV8S352_ENSVE|nr:hypothetical protein OPV22_004334 [Ensete ventricosum]